MISVNEALKIVLSKARDFETEKNSLEDSLGRILREEIKADRDFPPYDRVTMDGIGIRFEDFQNGIREFKIAGIAAAGDPQKTLNNKGECLEVMTGAIMPKGLDTVIRYEDLEMTDGIAKVTIEEIQNRKNIHFKGSDRKAGDFIIKPGKKISSPEIGVCATVGKHEVLVSKIPKAIIISNGDELVDIDQKPKAHQIRKSNSYQIVAILKRFNISAKTVHLNDEMDQISKKLESILEEYDLIILSGGVSKGKFDFIPEALDKLGVEKHFHRVAQRPGKPFWFGTYRDKSTVFALPGNPVSSFMCTQAYLIPWLNKSLKAEAEDPTYAILDEDVTFKPDLTYFLEVNLKSDTDGKMKAIPVKGNGSGDLANLVDAEAFIVLPRGKNVFKKGEAYPVIPYRN